MELLLTAPEDAGTRMDSHVTRSDAGHMGSRDLAFHRDANVLSLMS